MARVLIVDDEEGIRRTVGIILTDAGHRIATAANTAEARNLLEAEEFDVVLSDIVMPGEDGLRLLDYVRERQVSTQFVLITGEPTLETATEALRLGAFDYLPKPVRKDAVCRVVARAAQVRELREQNRRLDEENRRHREELERLVEERTAELRIAMDRLGRMFESTVTALSTALEKRDPYTAGHQRRVTNLACAIWDRMGLGREDREGLRIAGLLHDLGKLQVPADILSKPSRLSPAELSLIREHPAAAWEILRPVEFPWPVATIVRQHHERLDGTGYPDQAAGDESLPQSRVLSVADVVEAMATHRPYRPALGIDVALAEIRKGSGTAFWPEAVEACIALFHEDGYRLAD